jgi:hypothetical protein
MRGVWYKPNQGQPLETSIHNDSRSHVNCVAINSQDNFAFIFGHLPLVIRFWEKHILNPINKQYFSNESFPCSADGVTVPFK